MTEDIGTLLVCTSPYNFEQKPLFLLHINHALIICRHILQTTLALYALWLILSRFNCYLKTRKLVEAVLLGACIYLTNSVTSLYYTV